MTPQDLTSVERSWAEFVQRRVAIVEALTRRFNNNAATTTDAEQRARWLYFAVAELVGLLSAPSRLETRARDLGASWPDPLVAPSFAIDGRAWMAAADECLPTWTAATEESWRQAWLLLSDVLAAETLSPFSDVAAPTGVEPVPPGPHLETALEQP